MICLIYGYNFKQITNNLSIVFEKMKMKKEKITISIQIVIAIILHSLISEKFIDVVHSVIFQLIVACFLGFSISNLMQFYKKRHWLKYAVWVYFFSLIYTLIRVIRFY